MARTQIAYSCRECGSTSLKWQGQCPACGAWNSLDPEARTLEPNASRQRPEARPTRLADLRPLGVERRPTGIGEFDRVLGGGLVPGSIVLVGGAPGIGKSTLLLQVAGISQADWPTLYVSGEESADQLALRARRLGLDPAAVTVMATTSVEEVVDAARQLRSACLIIDSIQTMLADSVSAAPGSPSQLRECTARLIQLAKTAGVAIILVGHVTKEGVIAGPRMLEHMVDAVLYFEDETSSRYRLLRSVKNRFGAANELGIFAMGEEGLREVRNPSAIFLSPPGERVAGAAVTVLHQGTRPLVVEVQALTDRGGGGASRRLAVGVDQNRLVLLLAALHRHGGLDTHDDDVFVNVVGGVRVSETAADLALLAAVASSQRGTVLPAATVVFGEVGLGGEIRPVAFGEERIREAAKLGFRRAIVPRANLARRPVPGIEVVGVTRLAEALHALSLAAG
ncbi:MAG: DNA repair protein RadA [Gammaproteobacteria bacterium]|nr:MAG: DNA repair protein RadA [Gammaproteobacteria bacterium]